MSFLGSGRTRIRGGGGSGLLRLSGGSEGILTSAAAAAGGGWGSESKVGVGPDQTERFFHGWARRKPNSNHL